MKIIVKKISKLTKALIATSFFITIIAIVSPVMAAGSNSFFFMARGKDLDLPRANNVIMGNIIGDKGGVYFYQKIHGKSGSYAMTGLLKEGDLINTAHMLFCPVFGVWWINVWWYMGNGKFRTTDTDIVVFFRESFDLLMPNTNGECISATIFMWLNPTKEYYLAEFDDEGNLLPPPLSEEPLIWKGKSWVLAGVLWDTGIKEISVGFGPGILPIGPLSYLTRYIEM